MENQLYKRNCNTGESTPMYPITSIDKVIDINTDKSLEQILQEYNHIWLPFKGNSKALTRQQIPDKLRRKGLWITYRSCKGNTITEWYNSDNFTNAEWGKNENWVRVADKDLIESLINESIAWHKNTKSGITGDTKSLFHWYETKDSFNTSRANKLIPLDSIAFVGENSGLYIQGKLFELGGIPEDVIEMIRNLTPFTEEELNEILV